MRKTLAVVTGLLAGVLVACQGSLAAEHEPLKPGTKAPDFTMKDYTGKEHKLSDLEGKVVVLEFSSQHCP